MNDQPATPHTTAYERGYLDALAAARTAVLMCRYGPPSMWAHINPQGWHLDRNCTPLDASMHDNGCIDAARAIMALRLPERAA